MKSTSLRTFKVKFFTCNVCILQKRALSLVKFMPVYGMMHVNSGVKGN